MYRSLLCHFLTSGNNFSLVYYCYISPILSIMPQFSIGCLVFTRWRFYSVWVQLGRLSESLWWLQSSAVCIQAGQSWCHSVADNQLSIHPRRTVQEYQWKSWGLPKSSLGPRSIPSAIFHCWTVSEALGIEKDFLVIFIPSELESKITF